jgi:hypothetical protein
MTTAHVEISHRKPKERVTSSRTFEAPPFGILTGDVARIFLILIQQFFSRITHTADEDSVILDAIRATRPPFVPSEVVSDYSNFLKSFGLSSVSGG